MAPKTTFLLALGLTLAGLSVAGCAKHIGILAPPLVDPVVFDDTFSQNEDFKAFAGSKLDALSIDQSVKHGGTASLRITVPAPGDTSGGFAGGAFVTTRARDLSGYDAITFWAKASRAITLDVTGFGNDNTGTSKYTASWSGVALTTTWQKYVIPIPLAAKLTAEKGLFYFAEGPEGGAGSTFWLDDITFASTGIVTDPRPSIPTQTLAGNVGTSVSVPGTKVTFNVCGVDETIDAMPAYFTFLSSDETIARPGIGAIQIVGAGTAQVTATLGTVFASGTITLRGIPAGQAVPLAIFDESLGAGIDYQAFAGSKVDAVTVDTNESHTGSASLRVTVPAVGDPSGTYAGGAFVSGTAHDLSSYDALVFWAKASRPITLDIAGLGNDNTGTSKYTASRSAIPLTTTWARYVLPIPLAAKLTAERGLFFFAEGPEGGAGSTVWLDDVVFDHTGLVSNPRPAIATATLSAAIGSAVAVSGTRVTFLADGSDATIDAMPGYFTFASSDESVVTVNNGTLQVVGAGTAVITARLGTVDATGALTVNAEPAPTAAPPRPTASAANVISLLSDAYTNVPVDTWSATWDQADVADVTIGSDHVKKYTNLVYAGVEFIAHPIDATAMAAFHLDVWLPRGTTFKVKLVDFGANGIYGGGDDSQQELTFDASSVPPLTTGSWVGLDIPLSAFTGLQSRAHLAQLLVSGDSGTAYLDNVYFHK